MLKIFFLLIFSFITINSEAQGLRCFDLFAQSQVASQKNSAPFYAEVIDSLNEKYNSFLFKKSLSEILAPQLNDAPFFERTVARYQAYKLRKVLKDLHEFDQYLNPRAEIDVYALEKLSVKLEKLSFLSDPSVTENMSYTDKILFRQAQHSLLSQGLKRFLFSNEPLPAPSKLKRIYKLVITPFKDIYFRWTYAVLVAPKLNGATIPFEIMEKVVWEGYENNKALLAPYLLKTQSKHFFNVFSTSYNWIMVGTLLFTVNHLAQTTYHDVYLAGREKAVQMLTPGLEHSEKIAQTDWAHFKETRRLDNYLIEFRNNYQREPTAEEMIIIKQLLKTKAPQ